MTPIPPLTAADAQTQSADIVAANINRLRELFPEACTEGKIDFDVLKQLLGGEVDEREEKYGLNWHGKRRARQLALTTSTGTLRPVPGDGVDEATTKNIVIEGDNLEVLKLLQKSYSGQVKLIYIDPPYNTGNDFVYPDDFRDSIGNYKRITGQVDGEGRKLTNNPETSGRFHTDWLNMMYPRLKLAKNLLREDGVIFVSCDDQEVARLRELLDDIFGAENFGAQLVWQRSKKGDANLIAVTHEYILCHTRSAESALEHGVWRRKKEGVDSVVEYYQQLRIEFSTDHVKIRKAMMEWYRGLDDADPRKAHKHYNWSDDRGLYFAADFAGPDDGRTSRPRHDIFHPITKKLCKKPSTGWRWDEEKTNWALAQNPARIHFGEDESTIPTRKSYLFEIDSEAFPSVFYRDGRSATLEVESLLRPGIFQFPKTREVIMDLIALVTRKGDIVLDFFAGSGTTGHAVMAQNAADGGNRRYILVQLPEPLDPANKDQKTAANFCDTLDKPRTIAELTKERLRRAGKKIREEHPLYTGDYGFRVFKEDSSNIRTWEPDKADLPKTLEESTVHIKPDRTDADILVELLLKLGLDLCVPIETKTVAGKPVQSIGAGTLLVCLDESITRTDAEPLGLGIAAWHKQLAPAGESQVVFRDSAFEDDVAKSNLAAILQQHGLTNVRSL